MTIDGGGIRNILSVGRAPVGPEAKETSVGNNRKGTKEPDAEPEEMHAGDSRLGVENFANVPPKYAGDVIVRRIRKGDKVKHVVR